MFLLRRYVSLGTIPLSLRIFKDKYKMAHKIFCQQCGGVFVANRSDAHFCSAKCTAQYYRENPNPDYIHAEKPHTHTFFCEQCGTGFVVNDYAFRSGKRTPKYCSTKCKQAAYRGRVNEQAARRQEHAKNTSNKPPKQQKAYRDAWEVLGVSRTATKAQIRSAWVKLCKLHHTDIPGNDTPENLEFMKEVNAAYDKLK